MTTCDYCGKVVAANHLYNIPHPDYGRIVVCYDCLTGELFNTHFTHDYYTIGFEVATECFRALRWHKPIPYSRVQLKA